jgi:hypothetical protein
MKEAILLFLKELNIIVLFPSKSFPHPSRQPTWTFRFCRRKREK